jgi:hypothetical protein
MQLQKWYELFFLIMPTAQIWAPSNYYLSGPVKDALCAHHFADENDKKRSFCDVL